jgi:hypothetical protein
LKSCSSYVVPTFPHLAMAAYHIPKPERTVLQLSSNQIQPR